MAIVLALSATMLTGAVDRHKFRTCQQGSFCRRFKKWMERPAVHEALWSVLPQSRTQLPAGGFSFQVQHRAEAAPHLLLSLTGFAAGVVRIQLDEIDPVFPRYRIPAGDALEEPLPPAAQASVTETEGGTSFKFGGAAATVEVVLRHSPLAIDVSVGGRTIQRLNARNFLNFERYRRPKEHRPPDPLASQPDADKATLDAAAHPHDLDTQGLWEEDFGGHTDKKPRGPAAIGMDVSFEGDVPSVFGLPEHATKAQLPFYGEPYRFYNLDVFEYELNEPMALYGAVPMIWAIHRGAGGTGSIASGFLWINPSETFVKLDRAGTGVQAWWTSESGVMDVLVFVGPTPADVSRQYHALTGPPPIPPLWAMGKHQCRWNYMSEKDVLAVDSAYDKHDMPYDVVWLDIEHTEAKAYFTWNSANFPTPHKMMEAISAKRRKMVNVVDPHIKKSTTYHVYTDVRDKGLFVKKVNWQNMDDVTDAKPSDWVDVAKISDPSVTGPPEGWNPDEDGVYEPPRIDNPEYKGEWKPRQVLNPDSPMSDFEGWCWPGTSGYPDFTDPAMREYWGSQFALNKYAGSTKDTYVWNDMNEPSVFNGPEVTMPRDVIHPFGKVEHRDVHNIYGYYVHRATFEGLQKRSPGDRPFVLTRSFFVQSHKYAAIWTGDNTARWDHLEVSAAMVGALTLCGQSLVGADVGGFFKHPDAELMLRWYQFAALGYPFFRNHAHLETPRREPYTYDDKTMGLMKDALQLRYRMLPLWYTLFEAHHRLGQPVVRPLFWDFLADPETHTNAAATELQLMMGDAVLVYVVGKPLTELKEASVYLPKGDHGGWYDLYTGEFSPPGPKQVPLSLESIPAYVRGGAILPLKSRVRRSSACMAQDPFSLSIYLDPAASASGRLYVDDYTTQQYKDGRSFLDVEFQYKDGTLSPSSKRGTSLPSDISAEVEKLEVYGLSKPPVMAELEMDGQRHELPPPVTFTAGVQTAVRVKVKPWINLRAGQWALRLRF